MLKVHTHTGLGSPGASVLINKEERVYIQFKSHVVSLVSYLVTEAIPKPLRFKRLVCGGCTTLFNLKILREFGSHYIFFKKIIK